MASSGQETSPSSKSKYGVREDSEEDKNQKDASSFSEPSTQSTSEWLAGLMKRQFGLADKSEYPDQLLPDLTLDGVCEYIKSGKCQNIITMAGAGISTSAGIPDFRSPGTGLYDNLLKYDLPTPQAIFDIGFFQENPEPFFTLAKELFPGTFKPTVCHYFIKLLELKGILLRHFSQNIDTLERVAGISPEKIVEAHGTFHTSHCLECCREYNLEWMKDEIFKDRVPKCIERDCNGVVKPDIVFFGEPLPKTFFQAAQDDIPKCDLLIILGTSLVVQPFASLINRVPDTTPRLYLNLQKTEGNNDPIMALLGIGHGFRFDQEDNYRDVFYQSDCDSSCMLMAERLGWKKELDNLVKTGQASNDEGHSESGDSKKCSSEKDSCVAKM